MSTHLLQVDALSRSFGAVTALSAVSFCVARGELVGLVGHNGAGKSTLMSLLTGRLLPTSGTARVCGIDVHTQTREALAHIGLVAEQPTLFSHLSAREMLMLVAEIRGGGNIDAALEIAALGDDADRPIAGYSQGMGRRTAIAAALVSEPALLVLDEALNGLDPPSVERTSRALRAHADAGGGVLVSTHVSEVLGRADRVLVLAEGRLVADVDARTLDARARHDLLVSGTLQDAP